MVSTGGEVLSKLSNTLVTFVCLLLMIHFATIQSFQEITRTKMRPFIANTFRSRFSTHDKSKVVQNLGINDVVGWAEKLIHSKSNDKGKEIAYDDLHTVFINQKSGGKVGARLFQNIQSLCNSNAICDLTMEKPTNKVNKLLDNVAAPKKSQPIGTSSPIYGTALCCGGAIGSGVTGLT